MTPANSVYENRLSEAIHDLQSIRPDVPVIPMSGHSVQEIGAPFAANLAGSLQTPMQLAKLGSLVSGVLETR
ncbi:MAG: hypothetical protein ACE5GX_02750 [Thermoanaerobaculia bacterium]